MEVAADLVTRLSRGMGVGLYWACFVHCFTEYIAEVAYCKGASMEPTLYDDDIVLVSRIGTWCSKHSRNEGRVVIAKSLQQPDRFVCKRVVQEGMGRAWTGRRWAAVPEGYVWLQGDNGEESLDSRQYGPVPGAMLRGTVLARLWPEPALLTTPYYVNRYDDDDEDVVPPVVSNEEKLIHADESPELSSAKPDQIEQKNSKEDKGQESSKASKKKKGSK